MLRDSGRSEYKGLAIPTLYRYCCLVREAGQPKLYSYTAIEMCLMHMEDAYERREYVQDLEYDDEDDAGGDGPELWDLETGTFIPFQVGTRLEIVPLWNSPKQRPKAERRARRVAINKE